MSSLVTTTLTLGMVVGIGLLGWWGSREGFRQGDAPFDLAAEALLVPHWDGRPHIQINLANPAGGPAVVLIGVQTTRQSWPALMPGRSTRRRCPPVKC
jgi:hypothetical protein